MKSTRIYSVVVVLSLALTSGSILPVVAGEAAPPKSLPDALSLYADAASFQNNGAFELAAEEWEKFLKQYPQDPLADKARHYAGVCRMQLKQYARAVAHLRPVVAKGKGFELAEDALLNLAWCQYSLGSEGQQDQYASAADGFATLLKEYPQGKYVDQALFYRGESLYALGRPEEATAAYRQLLSARPESSLKCQALYALGVAFEEQKKYAEAGAVYDRFLEGCATSELVLEVRMRKAETVLQSGKPAEAEKLFFALASTPDFEQADHALLRQAYCAAAQNAFERAAEIYAIIPDEYPRSEYAQEATLSAGRCYYRAEQFAEAAKWLERVIQTAGPGAPEAAHWMARIHLRDKQPAKAVEIAQRVLSATQAGEYIVPLRMDLADAYYAQPDRRAEAVAKYLEIAQQHPEHESAPQALYNAAFAHWELEQYQDGLAWAADFLKKYAAHELAPEVQHVAAECQLKLGNLTAAETTYRELVAQHAGHESAPQWHIRLALVLYLQKNYTPVIQQMSAILDSLKSKDQVAEAQFLIGVSQFQQERFAEAEKSLTAALAAQPGWRQADETLLFLARARSRTNRPADAIKTLRKLIADFPESRALDQAHYRLGEFHYAQNDFAAAVSAYDVVLANWPQSLFAPYALYGRGWGLLKLQKYSEAADAFSRLIKDHPQPELVPEAHSARALCRRQLKQYVDAMSDIAVFLRSDPAATARADAVYERGLCEVGIENFDAAAKTFEQLLADNPEYANAPNVLYELAWVYRKMDKPAESVAVFERLARQYSDSPLAAEANWRLGENRFDQGEYQEAVKLYNVAKEQAAPGEVDELATHKLGWALFRLDDYEGALAQFAQQMKAYPQGSLAADALFMQGECQFKLQRYEQALATFDKASQSNLSKPDMQVLALLHGGQSAAELKRWPDSVRLLDQIVSRFPDTPYLAEALGKRGWAKQQLRRLDEALADYEEASARSRGEAGAHARFLIGELQFERKEHIEAIKNFQRVMYGYGAENAPPEVQHWQAMAGYEAGRCAEVQIAQAQDKLDRSKRVSEAKGFYTYVVQRHPTHDLAVEAQQRLAALQKL